MNGIDLCELLKTVAANGLKNQVVRPGDYMENGLLMCGKCHKPRQSYLDLSRYGSDEKVVGAVPCRCEVEEDERKKQEARRRELMESLKAVPQINLTDKIFSTATLDQFQETKFNARNLKLCRRYAEGFGEMLEKSQGLLFWGGVGTGKSYSAACIANYLRARGVPVIMTSFVMLLQAIQDDTIGEAELIAKLNRAELVVFDDLGAERDTGYALEKVYGIIEARCRKKLPMIFTTNLTIEEMKNETDVRYGRIYDRVFETCYPMQFTGNSWRKKEASKRFAEMDLLMNGGEK